MDLLSEKTRRKTTQTHTQQQQHSKKKINKTEIIKENWKESAVNQCVK